MIRAWYERLIINTGAVIAITLGGAIMGMFLGFGVISAADKLGYEMVIFLLLAIFMLWIGTWFRSMINEEVNVQKKDNYSA